MKIKIALLMITYSGVLYFPSIIIALTDSTTLNNTPVNQSSLSDEKNIIEEIQSLLQHGTVPKTPFKEWCNTHALTLISSKREPVKKLGLFFQKLTTGNNEKIDAFNVLSIFEKAVQEYDPKFRMGMLQKPIIIAKGTYWYLKPTKQTRTKARSAKRL